ncbi:hypothetical protein ACPPTR_07800, partial [Ralstonia pseudosolanacearum]|uniref:hypothetical protein n=1 Tax=Ralstonia pseudosolanacearum TaxID=1310165 RepID=UPI003C7C097C
QLYPKRDVLRGEKLAHPDTHLDKIVNGTKQDLDSFLAFFLWECPSSMIPTKEEVLRWAEALDKRGSEFASDAAACREFVRGNGDLVQARVVYDPARDLLVATLFATGAALEAQDSSKLAELLFAAGVRHSYVAMPRWQDEADIAPATGDKVALNFRLSQLGQAQGKKS